MERGSGILLHITSLPSEFGIGDLGHSAYSFVDFLAAAGQKYWQLLPLNPTDQVCGNSPYTSVSAFASNTLLISPELLLEDGLLEKGDLEGRPDFPSDRCDYRSVVPYKLGLLDKAYSRFCSSAGRHSDYEGFCVEHAHWLDNFAFFIEIKKRMGGKVWSDWPEELRDREPSCIEAAKGEFAAEIERQRFLQFLVVKQWFRLKDFCDQKGINLIGDVPIYVNYDSVDVWANPHLFKLDERTKRPTVIAGVPPDYFSKTGQLWGNPVYRWDRLKETGFDWWMRRLGHVLHFFHKTRVDHFRGFVDYWEVPADHKTAAEGEWEKAPAVEFFTEVKKRFPESPIIAEDLGIITDEVREVMKRFDLPGMKVLLFAFNEDNPEHPYLPKNFVRNCVVYTGTHDNNTARGWFENEASEADKKRLCDYVGQEVTADDVNVVLIKLAMGSVADLVLIPMQDVLGLGEDARMNMPASPAGNWAWRVTESELKVKTAGWLREMAEASARLP